MQFPQSAPGATYLLPRRTYLVRELERVDSRVRHRLPIQLISPPVLQAVADREDDRCERREELQCAGHREALPIESVRLSADSHRRD